MFSSVPPGLFSTYQTQVVAPGAGLQFEEEFSRKSRVLGGERASFKLSDENMSRHNKSFLWPLPLRISPALLRQASYGTIKIGTYNSLKRLFVSRPEGECPPVQTMSCCVMEAAIMGQYLTGLIYFLLSFSFLFVFIHWFLLFRLRSVQTFLRESITCHNQWVDA